MYSKKFRFATYLVSAGLLGLVGVADVAHAADAVVKVVDASGAAISGAMIAVVNSDGDSIGSAITGDDGNATVDDSGAAGLVVAAPGYRTSVVNSVAASVTLTASTKSKLSYSNAYGGQVRTVAADAESGVFYATTDAQPSVWRTTDYAGTWAPVPTSADDTEASGNSAGAMTQNQSAGEIFTSAAKGEVAVQAGSNLYYSRNYGNTWMPISTYSQVNGMNKKHYWVHGGAAGEYSMIFVSTAEKLYAAVVPDSKNDSTPAAFADVTGTIGGGAYTAGDRVGFAVGANGDMYMVAANATRTVISKLTPASTPASITAAPSGSQPSVTVATSGNGWVKLSTLGGDTPVAYAAFQESNSAATFKAGVYESGSWSESTGIEGTSSQNGFSPWDVTGFTGTPPAQNSCGWNGNTPLVGSIAPVAPAGVLSGLELAGTVGQCMFSFNSSGGTATIGSQSFAQGKVQLLPMDGANNNTGFVWDSGYDFVSNMVAISGDGQFGVRKSSEISSDSKYRPQFGGAGGTDATMFVNSLAKPGTDSKSGGIAVNGMTAPNITDMAYDPNSTDGSRLVVSTTETGGSRTFLSTDGGASFSTLGAGGSRALDWWNGADGVQHIAATFTLGSDFLKVKSFKTSSGDGKFDMGDELAATAEVRDSQDPSTRKVFVFGSAVNPDGSTFGLGSLIPGGGQSLTTAIEGIPGQNMFLIGASKCSDNVGPTGCNTSAGSVALVRLSLNEETGNDKINGLKYFGSEVGSSGANSVSGSGTYTAGVNAVQYCPTGSATKVADTAFISVAGKGIYKISTVTTAPTHGQTGTTSGTYKDMKVDCDTGIIAAAGADGLYLSIDGGAKFFAMKLNAAPGGGGQPPTAVALQADAATGDVTVAVGSGNGDVKSVETSFQNMGLTGAAVAAGTATPPSDVTPSAGQVNEVNNSQSGKNTGVVPDLELPAASGDKVGSNKVRSSGVTAFAGGVKLSVGTAGGAFKATVKTTATTPGGSTGGGGNTGGGGTGGGGTTVVRKVAKVKKAKTITVAAALKALGVAVVSKSTISATTTTKTVCSVSKGTVVKGLKKGTCKLKVKITPPKTKKVPKPKAVTKSISITVY